MFTVFLEISGFPCKFCGFKSSLVMCYEIHLIFKDDWNLIFSCKKETCTLIYLLSFHFLLCSNSLVFVYVCVCVLMTKDMAVKLKHLQYSFNRVHWKIWGFPGGSVVKNLPANAGDQGLIPGSGRSPGEGNGNPLQNSCLVNPMDRGAWWDTVHGV